MILEENEVMRRKTAMTLFALEQALGEYVLKDVASLADMDGSTVGAICGREKSKGRSLNDLTPREFVSSCYLDDLVQLAEKRANGTTDSTGVKRLKELFRVLEVGEIRNACAHPLRNFSKAYWHRLCTIISDYSVQQLGFSTAQEALISAELGMISDPPAEWLAEVRWSLPNNLPERFEHAATGLVGRNAVRDQVLKALASPRVASVAVVARGGVGKTALLLDVLNNIASSPKQNQWCDRIIFVTLKSDALTAAGIIRSEVARTLNELRDQIAEALDEQVGLYSDRDPQTVFADFSEEKVLLCIDNLETIIRDHPDAFRELNAELPATWRLVVTSRIRVDNALTIPITDLSPEDALILTHKYAKSVAFVLPDSIAKQVARNSRFNALAIKLTIDLLATGQDFAATTTQVASEISQFSYDRLIDALSEAAVKALEVIFVVDGCTRADILAALEMDADTVADALGELSNTSLISREIGEISENFHLNESVREFLRVNPRNVSFRSEVSNQLRRQREVRAQAKAEQDYREVHCQSFDYVPEDIPEQLAALCFASNKAARQKKKNVDVRPLLEKFRNFESEFGSLEIFWRAYGRAMHLVDAAAAELMYQRACELAPGKPQPLALKAWLYSLQGKHPEAVEIYKELVNDGWHDVAKGGDRLSTYVREGLLRSLLFGASFQEVIDQTEDWRATASSIEEQAPSRIGALRQVDLDSRDRKPHFIEAFDVLDEATARVGVSKALYYQGMKLYKDFLYIWRRGCDDELLSRGAQSIAHCIRPFARFTSKAEVSKLGFDKFAIDAQSRSIEGANELVAALRSIYGVSVGHQRLLQTNGYVVARVVNVPRTESGDFPRFLFVRDSTGEDYFVSVESLKNSDWAQWTKLDLGAELIVKPKASIAKDKRPTSSETHIVG